MLAPTHESELSNRPQRILDFQGLNALIRIAFVKAGSVTPSR